MLPTSDLAVVQEFVKMMQTTLFNAGVVCDSRHHLVLRRLVGEVLSARWWLAFRPVANSPCRNHPACDAGPPVELALRQGGLRPCLLMC